MKPKPCPPDSHEWVSVGQYTESMTSPGVVFVVLRCALCNAPAMKPIGRRVNGRPVS